MSAVSKADVLETYADLYDVFEDNKAICKELNKIYDRLNTLPPAQPEIIRCKDCKHSEFWYRDKRRCFLWHEEGIDVFEDGFCNYAERRTDGRD